MARKNMPASHYSRRLMDQLHKRGTTAVQPALQCTLEQHETADGSKPIRRIIWFSGPANNDRRDLSENPRAIPASYAVGGRTPRCIDRKKKKKTAKKIV